MLCFIKNFIRRGYGLWLHNWLIPGIQILICFPYSVLMQLTSWLYAIRLCYSFRFGTKIWDWAEHWRTSLLSLWTRWWIFHLCTSDNAWTAVWKDVTAGFIYSGENKHVFDLWPLWNCDCSMAGEIYLAGGNWIWLISPPLLFNQPWLQLSSKALKDCFPDHTLVAII